MPTWACSTPLKTSRSMGKSLTTSCAISIQGQDLHWLRPASSPPCCLASYTIF